MIEGNDLLEFVPPELREARSNQDPVVFACSAQEELYTVNLDFVQPQPETCVDGAVIEISVWRGEHMIFDKRKLATPGCETLEPYVWTYGTYRTD